MKKIILFAIVAVVCTGINIPFVKANVNHFPVRGKTSPLFEIMRIRQALSKFERDGDGDISYEELVINLKENFGEDFRHNVKKSDEIVEYINSHSKEVACRKITKALEELKNRYDSNECGFILLYLKAKFGDDFIHNAKKSDEIALYIRNTYKQR